MLINIEDFISYFKDRDNHYVWYNPICSIGAKYINGEVWYECYYLPSDRLYTEYDYSTRDLRELLEWCNENLNTNFLYC